MTSATASQANTSANGSDQPVLRPPGSGAGTPPPTAPVPPGAYIPPGSATPSTTPLAASTTPGQSLNPNLLALGVLTLLALFVVFALPALVSDEPDTPQTNGSRNEPSPASTATESTETESTTASPTAPASNANQVATSENAQNAAQQKAQALLSEVLSLRAQLESQRVDRWAHEDYQQALNRAEEAAQAFTRRRYPQAVEAYEQALSDMQAILSTRESRFQDYLAQGELALEDAQTGQDTDQARQQFTTALAINPDSAEAKAGLEKAEQLKKALALAEEATALRQQGDMDSALEKLQQAHQLAPQSQTIELAYQGLKQALDNAEFQQAIADANQSIQAWRLTDARKAVNKAAKIDPQAPQIADLRQRISDRSQAAQIRALRRKADKAMDKEDWALAKIHYRKALKLDPNLSFATRGLARAEERQKAMKDAESYLSRPMRLSSDPVMNHARLLLEHLKDIQTGAPRLQAKARELESLIKRMSVPVAVSITSDGQTQLLLHRIRRLGTLSQTSLTLRPGEYVISGSRDGYRDIRRTLTIQPGEKQVDIDVRCEEPI